MAAFKSDLLRELEELTANAYEQISAAPTQTGKNSWLSEYKRLLAEYVKEATDCAEFNASPETV